MKKLYLSFLMMMVSMLYSVALAASITLTVKVNDPSMTSVETYYYPKDDAMGPVTFNESKEAVVNFPDGAQLTMLKVAPVTPKGSETVYFKSYTIYDCDGKELKKAEPVVTTSTYVEIPTNADGGWIEIECTPIPNKKIEVTVEGTLEKVSMNAFGTPIELQLGTQTVEITPDAKYVQIKPVGVASLYSVKYNGEELPLLEDGLEGVISRYYSINSPKDGDVIVIKTDYSDSDCFVTIDCNFGEFIKSVTVNEVEQNNWNSLVVKAGDLVAVTGDAYNYVVNSCGINDVVYEYPTAELSVIVNGDTKFMFNVTPKERDGQLIFYAEPGIELSLSTNDGSHATIPSGYTTLGFNEGDKVSLEISKLPENTSTEALGYVYINDVMSGDGGFNYNWDNLKSGDVIKAYVAVGKPQTHSVEFKINDLEGAPVVVKDLSTQVDCSQVQSVLPGTQFKITASEGQNIANVKVNDVEIASNYNEEYIFTVDDKDCSVQINGVVAVEPRIITVKSNLPEGVMVRYADDYLFEASVAGAQYNINEYDAEWGDYLMIAPMTNYLITSVLYNGTEVRGNEEYDWGGAYYFYELKDGDVFDITAEAIVRDQPLTVYMSGLQNVDGYYLADVTGQTELSEGKLVEGYNTVYFAEADLPLLFGVLTYKSGFSKENVFVYLNDEKVNFDWGWNIDCKAGDVLKIYIAPAEPEVCTLQYTLAGLDVTPIIVHDYVNTIAEPGSHTVLPGTYVSIASGDIKPIISVTVNGAPIETLDGTYSFEVKENSAVVITGISTGINAIDADANGANEIYNLQGIKVRGDLQSLPAGIYIVNGKKISKK